MDYDSKSQTAFSDPLLRCDSCNTLVQSVVVKKRGCCPQCGNRRMRNVQVIQMAEMEQCKVWGIDSAFLALFEEVEELTPPKFDIDTSHPTPEEIAAAEGMGQA